MKLLTFAFLSLVLLGVVAAPVLATTFHVPSQYQNIQAGVDAAGHGDTVLVADGTYAGGGNRDLDFNGTNLILLSENGPEFTTVDCGGSFEEPHRAINFHSGETRAAVVDGFTFQHGHLNLYTAPDGWGGAIVCEVSSPTIRNCHFLDNQVLAAIVPPGACGGAIAVGYSAPEIIDCYFEGNSASNGGAVYAYASNITLSGCTMVDNSVCNEGPAFGSYNSDGSFTDCVIARHYNGVGTLFLDGNYRISRCTIVDNRTYDGIVHVFGPSTIFENSIIAFNPEIAVMCSGTATIDVICCDVFGNAVNWLLCLEEFEHINDNMCEDPLFCDLTALDLTLDADSPCATHSNCGLIGACPVGCGVTAVPDLGTPGIAPRLSVLPNPVLGRAEFTVDHWISGSVLELYDARGRLADVLRPSGPRLHWAPTSSTPSGVYFVRLRGPAGSDWLRFVVVK